MLSVELNNMTSFEAIIWVGVLALIAGSGVVRLLAALFFPAIRESVKSHRVAHTCWFVGSAVALLLLLRLLFPAREMIRLSSAANLTVERMAAGDSAWQNRERLAAAIAHFLR